MTRPAKNSPIFPASRLAPPRQAFRPRLVFAACALLTMAFLSSVAAAQPPKATQPHVGWDRTPVPGRPAGPPALNCKGEAARLQALFRCALSVLARAEKDNDRARIKDLNQQLEDIVLRWAELKAECPDIGLLSKTKPEPPPDAADAARNKKLWDSDPPLESDPLGNLIVPWLFGIGLEDLVGEGVLTGGKLLLHTAAEIWAEVAIEAGKGVVEGADSASGSNHPESHIVGGNAGQPSRRKADSLNGYVSSLARYRGALATGDGKTMAVQAQAMVKFALEAQSASREIALKQYEGERAVRNKLDEAWATMARDGVRWQDAMRETQAKIKKDGLPPRLVEAMRAANLSDEKIAAYRHLLESLTPQQVEQQLATQKNRLQDADSMRQALAAENATATWPEPPELVGLATLEYDARKLYRRVTQTRIELSFQSPNGANAAKPAAPAEAAQELPTWWAVPTGTVPRLHKDTLISSPVSGPLAPGKYDVYLAQSAAQIVEDATHPIPATVCVARGILLKEGTPSAVVLRTGLYLQLAKGAAKPLSWFVLPSDAPFTTPVAERDGGSTAPLWLVPGRYDVYYIQSAEHRNRPRLLTRTVEVTEGKLTPILVEQTTVGIQLAPWTPLPEKEHGWWGLVQSGDAPAFTVMRSQKVDTLSVLPGTYDCYWVQDYDHRDRPLLLAQRLEMRANSPVTIPANSGIQLQTASWVPARDNNYGWWGVTVAGEQPKDRVHWSNSADTLLLPPGKYDVYWVQDFDHRDQALLLHDRVLVKSGALTAVSAHCGIRLKMLPGMPTLDTNYGWWGVVPTGSDSKQPIHWAKGQWDQPLLVRPGTYDIIWKHNYDHVPEVIRKGVVVEAPKAQATPAPIEVEVQFPAGAGPK